MAPVADTTPASFDSFNLVRTKWPQYELWKIAFLSLKVDVKQENILKRTNLLNSNLVLNLKLTQ